jgi:hypothetical protein
MCALAIGRLALLPSRASARRLGSPSRQEWLDSSAGSPSSLVSVLLDRLMPEFDAARIEHRVIDGRPADVYKVAIHADFLDAMRRSRIVRGLFGLRAAGERVAAAARRAQAASPPEPVALRLAEMPEHGDWVRLGEDPPTEFAFAVIGRFWGGETAWKQIDSSAFTSFDIPGYAKIAANLPAPLCGGANAAQLRSAHPGNRRNRSPRIPAYWTIASPGAGVVMRSLLAVIADDARGLG